jgi:prophage antirepressor-like protein
MTKRENPMVTVGGDSRNKDVPVNAVSSAVPLDVRPILFNDDAVRIVVLDGEVMFVASDVTAVLGYGNSSAAVAKHCKAPITITKREGGFLTVIPERDVYRLVVRSKLPAAERFEEWLVGEVVPSIRRTGSYVAPGAPAPTQPAVPSTIVGDLHLAEIAARVFHYSPSSKLAAFQRVARNHKLDMGLLPSHTVDAPDPHAVSSEVTKSATVLLKEHGAEITASALYVALARLGYMKKGERQTTSKRYPGGVKRFWTVTPKGLPFGKNISHPESPREVSPHWYEHRFTDLLDIVRNANEGGV